MKALTFEDWDKIIKHMPGPGGIEGLKKAFDLAREGMITEDEAVRIPTVEEWPDGYNRIAIEFVRDEAGGGSLIKHLKSIPRPIPAWTPKVGEAVFALDQLTPNGVWVARVVDSEANGKVYVVCNDGDECTWGIDRLKPFDASKIGKPWEEI